MNCYNKVEMCKIKFHECDFRGSEQTCPLHRIDCGGDNIPSFSQWKEIYLKLSEKRHEQTGTLDKTAIRNIIHTFEEFKKVMGYSDDDKVTLITRKTLAEYCSRLKVKQVSKKAKCEKIGQIFARWIRFEVEGQWNVPTIVIPELQDDSDRFHELDQQTLVRIAQWHRSLYNRGGGIWKNRCYLYTMLMYRYAMRNSDIDRLKWDNIEVINGRYRLKYVPHKTRLSSKRTVKVWMDALDYADLMEYRKSLASASSKYNNKFVFGGGHNLSLKNEMNKEITGLNVPGTKKLYLLRKICIHNVFMQFGQEAAVAISGDDFRTIKVHYADPDAVEVSAAKYLLV